MAVFPFLVNACRAAMCPVLHCCTYCLALQEAQSSWQDLGVSTAGPSLRKVVSGFPSLAMPWNLRSSLCTLGTKASSSLPGNAPVKYMDSPSAQPTEDLVSSVSSFNDSCLSYRGFSLFLLLLFPQKEQVGIGEMVQQLVLAAQS